MTPPTLMARRYRWPYPDSWPPGSDEAVRFGCDCPRAGNTYGHGIQTSEGVRWSMVYRCKVHGGMLPRAGASGNRTA